MNGPARTNRLAVRLLAGLVPLVALIGATAAARQQVVPSVPPPVPAPRGHAVRAQTPLPVPMKLGSDAPAEATDRNGKNGDAAESGPELTLGECIAIALERQPSLRALTHSIAATEAGYRALTNFGKTSTLFSPDLEIRKQQAQRGAMATTAEYQKLHNEVVQDVTRLYYTAVYAQQQQELARRIALRLESLVVIGREILKNTPAKDLEGFNLLKLSLMENGLLEARKLQVTARVGREKALAGLREVMAVDGRTFPFRLYDDYSATRPKLDAKGQPATDPKGQTVYDRRGLPVMSQSKALTQARVVELAVERRPELVLAAAGVDAFRLEVYAQGKIPFRRVAPTLASGKDIHATEIPQSSRGAEYRPGGILPEMPVQLVGSKYDRVCRAMAFAKRAEAVYDKARNLIMLEAETAYLDYEQASDRLTAAKEQFALSEKIQEQAQTFGEILKSKDQIVQAEVTAAKAQSDYFEAVHQYLLALAALERVTAGGIRPEFPGR